MTLLHQAAQKAVELKLCPFCGGDAELDARQAYCAIGTGRGGTRIAVYCRDCGADIGCCREDVPDIEPEQVIEMWNRRVALDDLPALVRQLVHALRKAAPEHTLAERALDYLRRHGLQGSPLRTAALQQQPEPVAPTFASAVARRKWESLQADGYRMQRIHFARSVDGHERRGTIDPWGKVLWEAETAASPSTTRQQEVGSGWKLVPVEPTREMVRAASVIRATMVDAGEWCVGIGGAIDAYEAMLAAAPSTPENAGGVKESPESRRERLIANGYKTDSRCKWLAIGRCAGCGREHDGGVGVPATRFGKPYLDGLIDRLLMPLPSMPARDVQKLMGEAAEMIHQLASPNAGVMASGAPISFEAVDGRILSGPSTRPHDAATCPWCKDADGVGGTPK